MNRKTAYNLRKNHQMKITKWLCVVGVTLILGIVAIQQVNNSKFLNNNWRTNIVFHTEPTTVISFSKQASDRTIIFTLPSNVIVNVPFGYQQYQLQAVWKLAQMEKKYDIYSQTIEDLFATYVSGWVGQEDLPDINSQSEDIFKQLSAHFSLIKLLTSPNISNLSLLDRFLMWWELIQVQNKSDLVDLTQPTNLIETQTLPDTSIAKSVNHINWFKLLTEKLVDTQIRQEGLSIEVRNSTLVRNVGQKFAQILTNSGAKVISLNNISKNIEKCEIIYNPKLSKSKIIKWLTSEFGCAVNLNNETNGMDILIILGKYYGDRWVGSE